MHHKVDFVVVGGGLAGLSAAIGLANLGKECLVIEGGSYPSHKICGEFLSPECLPFLEGLGICPIPISEAVLKTSKQSLRFPFLPCAAGLSHMELDPALVSVALKKGVTIKTETKTTSFRPKNKERDVHLIELSNGDFVEASNAMIAAGRFSDHGTERPEMIYMGCKAHFEGIPLKGSEMKMFSFPGAYLGVSPIEGNKFNVACLADLRKIPDFSIERFISENGELRELFSQSKNLFSEWMVSKVPDFGMKKTPDWKDVYFIGDAALTVPPACGNGLSIAIFGGQLAAEYGVRGEWCEFKRMWRERCASQLFWAKALHRLMMNPKWGDYVLQLSGVFPIVSRKFFQLTRQETQNLQCQ